MKMQLSFSSQEYAGKKKRTRREKFLGEMEKIVPWEGLQALIKPYYPSGKRGRPPIGLERMLRIYFLQQWYGLADEALEDALYDSQSLREFAGIDLGVEDVPDATTLLKFRRLLERHDLTRQMLESINALLEEKKLLLREGTIMDATIIAAAPSTKNRKRERDPAMHQTKKGNQWYFGMKAHIGVDDAHGLVHRVEGTAANVSDVSQAHRLLHGKEKRARADAGYVGVEKRAEILAHQQATGVALDWHIARRRRSVSQQPEGLVKAFELAWETLKARARAIVEHPFHIVKNLFHYRKVRYRGLEKNTSQLHALFALANLYKVRRHLLPVPPAQVR